MTEKIPDREDDADDRLREGSVMSALSMDSENVNLALGVYSKKYDIRTFTSLAIPKNPPLKKKMLAQAICLYDGRIVSTMMWQNISAADAAAIAAQIDHPFIRTWPVTEDSDDYKVNRRMSILLGARFDIEWQIRMGPVNSEQLMVLDMMEVYRDRDMAYFEDMVREEVMVDKKQKSEAIGKEGLQ